MKYIYTIIFASIFTLNAQSTEQIKKQLNDSGVTLEQAKQMARDKGYTDNQIETEARARGIDDVGESKEANILQIGLSSDNVKKSMEISETSIEDENLSEEIVSEKVGDTFPYFGYHIFSGDPGSFQASTFGAVDPNYNIGPGDQIIVMLWGESQFRLEFNVDREGYVFLPDVGQVFVNGLDLESLEKKFFQILSKVYSTLIPDSGKPTTFMDISLGNLRPLRIIVLGEVSQPGAYSVSPSTSLSSSLYYFNGPTTLGSLRDIRLIRNGKQVGSIDFYDYLLSGNTPNDPRLQLDDIVFVPRRGKTVTIHGEVNRPGIFELKQGEGLKDLLQFTGDLSITAYMKRAQISRIVPVSDRSELGMDRMLIDIDLEAAITDNKNTEIRDGDQLEIFSIEDMEKNYVTLRGSSVMRPGRYQIFPEMRVNDLLKYSEGLLKNAYLEKAHIVRIKENLTSELIDINLLKVMSEDPDNNLILQFMDELIIYNKNDLTNIYTEVNISGPVKNPGWYNLKNNKKLGDLILMAGGFNSGINRVKISVARNSSNSFNPKMYYFPSGSSTNKYFNISQLENIENDVNKFILKSNDIINLYADPKDQLPKMINISGAVNFPGQYPIINKNEKVSDIIIRAGGLLPEAYPMASTFIRNNQKVRLSFEQIINNPKTKENFLVMPDDSIEILQKTNIVEVMGEVNNPGIFKFYYNSSVRDYINNAGGLTLKAEKKEIWVTYPDGTNQQLRPFMPAPRVYDGSVITVGREAEAEPFDKTEFAKEIASIISDFMQIVLTFAIISNTSSGS